MHAFAASSACRHKRPNRDSTFRSRSQLFHTYGSVPLHAPYLQVAPIRLRSHGLSDWLIPGSSKIVYPPQWINADLQTFDLTMLGKFDIIHQDTAFDIHMSLPYGTMTDASIRAMPIQDLQDTGFIFFWGQLPL